MQFNQGSGSCPPSIIPELWNSFLESVAQPAFTSSNLTIGTQEQGVKYVQS